MEYLSDLRIYIVHGPGTEVNTMVACPLMKYLKDSFDDMFHRKRGSFYFAHSPTILSMLSLLGIGMDDYPLTHGIFGKRKANTRRFITSFISPTASNIGFVLFKCDESSDENGDDDDEKIKYKIIACHNERPDIIEGCDDIACDWDVFKEMFEAMMLFKNF